MSHSWEADHKEIRMFLIYLSKVRSLVGGFKDQSEIDMVRYCFDSRMPPEGAAQYLRS